MRAGREARVGERCSVATSSSSGAQVSSRLRRERAVATAPAAGAITATTCPASTSSPGAEVGTCIVTMPAHGAVTTVSIFIAVTTSSVSPAAPTAPSRHSTSTTVPAIGHSTPRARPPPAAGRCSACAQPAARPRRQAGDLLVEQGERPARCRRRRSPSVGRLGEQRRARIAGAERRDARGSRAAARRFVGSPRCGTRRARARVRSTAEANVPDEFDWPITLASSGSNCGGGA